MNKTIQAFVEALKKARREGDTYRREHAKLMDYIRREGEQRESFMHNTRLLDRLRRISPRLVSALRQVDPGLANELIEIIGLSTPEPGPRRRRRS